MPKGKGRGGRRPSRQGDSEGSQHNSPSVSPGRSSPPNTTPSPVAKRQKSSSSSSSKKPVPEKAAAKKVTAKKPAGEKAAAKKPTSKKVASEKAPAKKPTAKKAAATEHEVSSSGSLSGGDVGAVSADEVQGNVSGLELFDPVSPLSDSERTSQPATGRTSPVSGYMTDEQTDFLCDWMKQKKGFFDKKREAFKYKKILMEECAAEMQKRWPDIQSKNVWTWYRSMTHKLTNARKSGTGSAYWKRHQVIIQKFAFVLPHLGAPRSHEGNEVSTEIFLIFLNY